MPRNDLLRWYFHSIWWNWCRTWPIRNQRCCSQLSLPTVAMMKIMKLPSTMHGILKMGVSSSRTGYMRSCISKIWTPPPYSSPTHRIHLILSSTPWSPKSSSRWSNTTALCLWWRNSSDHLQMYLSGWQFLSRCRCMVSRGWILLLRGIRMYIFWGWGRMEISNRNLFLSYASNHNWTRISLLQWARC